MDKQGKIKLVLALSLVLLIGLSAFAIAKPMLRKQVNVIELAHDSVSGRGSATPVGLKIKTDPSQINLVPDGETVYRMDVLLDTLGFPGSEFNAVEWDVVVPDYIEIVDAQLPSPDNPSTNPSDVFYDFLMDDGWNSVDSTVSGGELTDNKRMVDNVFEGPSDLSYKLLGSYWFTVNADAPLGQDSFDLNDGMLMDTDFNEYNTPDSGGDIIIENDIFRIVRPQCEGDGCYGDIDEDGNVDLVDFGKFAVCFGSQGESLYCPEHDFIRSDMEWDGWISLSDFATFAVNFGGSGDQPASQPEVTEFLNQLPEDATIEDAIQFLQL